MDNSSCPADCMPQGCPQFPRAISGPLYITKSHHTAGVAASTRALRVFAIEEGATCDQIYAYARGYDDGGVVPVYRIGLVSESLCVNPLTLGSEDPLDRRPTRQKRTSQRAALHPLGRYSADNTYANGCIVTAGQSRGAVIVPRCGKLLACTPDAIHHDTAEIARSHSDIECIYMGQSTVGVTGICACHGRRVMCGIITGQTAYKCADMHTDAVYECGQYLLVLTRNAAQASRVAIYDTAYAVAGEVNDMHNLPCTEYSIDGYVTHLYAVRDKPVFYTTTRGDYHYDSGNVFELCASVDILYRQNHFGVTRHEICKK